MSSQEEVRIKVEQATGIVELPIGNSSIFTDAANKAFYIASNAYLVDGIWYYKLLVKLL